MMPPATRAKLAELRADIVRGIVDRPVGEWAGLELGTRCLLLMAAGIDPDSSESLDTLAERDWREFTPPERDAIKIVVRSLRWQLNRARAIADDDDFRRPGWLADNNHQQRQRQQAAHAASGAAGQGGAA